jgi:hypothetical protein
MTRLTALLLILIVMAAAAPAHAASDWDPDEVEGPLDLRWIGARFAPHGQFVLAISFYDDFDPRAIPRRKTLERGVSLEFYAFMDGVLFRRTDGRIALFYGDFGSTCCNRAVAQQPSPGVLRFVFPTIDENLSYRVRASSTWRGSDREIVLDRTGILRLGAPPES